MRDDGPERRLGALMAVCLLSLSAVPGAVASESGKMRESQLATRQAAEVYERQDEFLVAATREWGADGAERKKLRGSLATLQKTLELVKGNLTSASEALQATAARVPDSGVLEKLDGLERAVGDAGQRLRARWELEHQARVREREQREREAAERGRGVR